MCKQLASCIASIDSLLDSPTMKEEVGRFLDMAENSPKWMLYSDYCLDDANKPNSVITFVMIPFLNEEKYKELREIIQSSQPKDLKHSKDLSSKYIEYITQQPVFSFSFLINDRKSLFGETHKDQIESVKAIINELKNCFNLWIEKEEDEEKINFYKEEVRKIDNQLKEIFQKDDAKILMDILLITLLGAHYSSAILKSLPNLETFGWFPDRDKTNEANGAIASTIFHITQYNQLKRQYVFCAAKPDSSVVPFYDDENRIADIICGTLADYNFDTGLISKDKFGTSLRELIADNKYIKIYRLHIVDSEGKISEIKISKTPFDSH